MIISIFTTRVCAMGPLPYLPVSRSYLFSIAFWFIGLLVFAQPSGNCDPSTPFFSVNLSGNPNGTWLSPSFPRIGNCCGTLPPDNCLEFMVTLDSSAVAINFQIASGAVPPGALYYQVNCGPQIAVGSPICLNGPGPYSLTFCKPGNNVNTYAITSIPPPSVSPNDTIGNGCSTNMYASYLLENSSISWNSVYPGTYGAYNSYLSCTAGCDSTVVTAQSGAPPYIDYVVCGTPLAGVCAPNPVFCDTIRIYFIPPVVNPVNPNPAVFCASDSSGVALTGTASGGLPPYTYAWTSGPNGTGVVVAGGLTYTATSAGNYSFIVYDQNYPQCPPAITNVSVTVSPVPVVNAGPDQTLCGSSVQLNASVTGATGGVWSGGAGTFSPDNTTPNAIYTPTASEIASGTFILAYTSTGNGACSPATDQVIINISAPLNVTLAAPAVLCFGQTASISANVSGGAAPYSYSWSSGQITQTISNVQNGTYNVTVTSPGVGCMATVSVSITSNVPGFSATTACLNTLTSFTDLSSMGNDTIVAWNWNFGEPFSGASNFSQQQNPSHTYSSAGTFASSLIVTTQKGCSDTITMQVTVNPLPVVSFTGAVSCGGTATFTNTSSINGGNITNWSWNFGDPNSGPANISNLQNPSHTYAVSGDYQVILTATSNQGCLGTLTQNISVPHLPIATFNVQNNCKGVPTLFTDQSSVAEGSITSWLWDFGDQSALCSQQDTSHIYGNNGNYTVTLIVTSDLGCQDTFAVAVNIYPMAIANFSAPSVCLGNPTSFTDLSSVSSGSINSWAWNFGDFSMVNTAQNPVYTYQAPGTFYVLLTVTSSNGCVAIDTVPVKVHPVPWANFSANAGCLNSSAIFNDQSFIASDTLGSWLWAFGDGSPVSNAKDPTHSYLQAGAYGVSLIVTSIHGCVDTSTQVIPVYGMPKASFTVKDSGGCAIYCPRFTDLSTCTDGTIASWNWNFGNGTMGFEQNPENCYTETGFYSITLTVTTSNGCSDTLTQVNYIEIFPVPQAAFTYDPQPPSEFNPQISFTDLSDTSVVIWNWDFGELIGPGKSSLQNPDHIYSDTGTYCITLIVQNIYKCPDTAVHCLRIEPEFTFYVPNAFTPGSSFGKNDEFGGVGTSIRQYEMWIFDRWGNMIFYSDDLNKKWDGKIDADKPVAQEDVYVYKVELVDVAGDLHRYSGVINLVR